MSIYHSSCWGCNEDQPNQMAHMDYGGCLSTDDWTGLETTVAAEAMMELASEQQQNQKQSQHLFFDEDGNTIDYEEYRALYTEPWKVILGNTKINTIKELLYFLKFVLEHNKYCAEEDFIRLTLPAEVILDICTHPKVFEYDQAAEDMIRWMLPYAMEQQQEQQD